MRLLRFPNHGDGEIFLDCLKAICGPNVGKETMLDCGCNLAPFTPLVGYAGRRYIDINDRVLDHSEEQVFFEKADVLEDLTDETRVYDTIIANDFIEHLTPDQGRRFLELAQDQSFRQVIFTPLGPYMLDESGTDPESHHSAWYPSDFNDEWAGIEFRNYHPTLGVGAFFVWRCKDIEADFERVVSELSSKWWTRQLAGVLMVYNGLSMDYCVKEAVNSLKALANHTFVIDCGSDDGTAELLTEMVDDTMSLLPLPKGLWDQHAGREKLSYFTNLGIAKAQEEGFQWVAVGQADEVFHESTFPALRTLIAQNQYDALLISRINLWGDSQHQLNVPQDRKPVSTEIVRVARPYYRAYDDAESLGNPHSDAQVADGRSVRLYHMGFVRDRRVHSHKIKNMQANVFQMDYDHRIDGMMDWWDPWAMGFTKDDVEPIEEPLPVFVQEWAEERDRTNKAQTF